MNLPQDFEAKILIAIAEAGVADDARWHADAVRRATAAFKEPSAADWMFQFELSQEDIDGMEDAKFVIPGLAISSQVNVIAAKPGCGKTSILMAECPAMVADGCDVMYVNMDTGAADMKYWRQQANAGGFRIITPHFKGGRGIQEWLTGLAEMSQSDADLSRLVIVVDTLKKIADLMNKTKARQAMSLLRALTAKQCTVICAAHCNKHRTPDGKLIFEGVGDIESDCDNLVYLEASEKDEFGSKIVTTEPSDKVRGIFHKRSWQIHEDRRVIALDVTVDVVTQARVHSQLEKDQTAIEVISTGIVTGHHKRIDLFNYATERKIGRNSFDAVLKRYTRGECDWGVKPLWRNEKQRKDNSSYYVLLD